MLRCALQMVSSETITTGHPMQAAPPHRAAWPSHEESPMSAQTQASQGPNLGMTVTTFENPMGIDGFEFVEFAAPEGQGERSEEHTSELQSLMRISYAVFCLKKTKKKTMPHQL